MATLFETTTIKRMTMKNRFVRSATYEAMAAPNGTVEAPLLDCTERLVRGGVGLVITGHAYVTREGQAGPRQMGIHDDGMLEGLRAVASVAHDNGGAIVAQLAHAGIRGIGGGDNSPLGPSDVFQDGVKTASAMTVEDIHRTVAAFGDAAERAVAAGFDGLQIHSAHGYLLSQFLSSRYNTRDDEYGGSLKNRCRLLVDVYDEIRGRVGPEYPVLIKINSEDFLEGGLTVDESLQVVRELESRGLDGVEMSGGTFESGRLIPSRAGTSRSEDLEVYYRKAAEAFKSAVGIPLILVGGFLSLNVAREAVTSGLADYVSLSRPLIREPELVHRWKSGNEGKAACLSCNRCFTTLSTREGLHCPVDRTNNKGESR